MAPTSTASNASIQLSAGTAPSAPGAGDVRHDSTRKAEYGFFAGISPGRVGAIFTQIADATVGNTVTETTPLASGVGTLSLPANFWTVGKTVRIALSSYWSQTGSSPTRTVKAYLGATTMLNAPPSTFGGGVTNLGFRLELVMTCRATAASGTVYTQGMLFLAGNVTYSLATTAAVTVDTTAAKTIDLKWTWGTADPSNTITVTNALVEVLQ